MSAEQGNATGQYALGRMYQSGRGVARDIAQATKWYLLAAAQSNADAQAALRQLAVPDIYLTVLTKADTDIPGLKFSATQAPILIGRATECSVCVPHSLVSKKHCEFFVHDDKWAVRDLGSSNGTFLNDQPVAANGVYVSGSGCVRLGKTMDSVEVLFTVGAAPAPGDAEVGEGLVDLEVESDPGDDEIRTV